MTDALSKDDDADAGKDGRIALKIATSAGVYEGTFALTDTVDEVIAKVVEEKHLAQGDAFRLALDGEELPGDSKLWSLDLKTNSELDLIASGSAV